MARNAWALITVLTISVLTISVLTCAGCGSMGCTERLSWEPPGGAVSATVGLFTVIELVESDHIEVNHTLLETQVDPPYSSIYIYNRTTQELNVTKLRVAYSVEGQSLRLEKVTSWDLDSSQQPVKAFEAQTVQGIVDEFNPVRPDGQVHIGFHYAVEDSRRNRHATMTFDLEYEWQGHTFHLAKTLDLVKFSTRYNCIFGEGTPKHQL